MMVAAISVCLFSCGDDEEEEVSGLSGLYYYETGPSSRTAYYFVNSNTVEVYSQMSQKSTATWQGQRGEAFPYRSGWYYWSGNKSTYGYHIIEDLVVFIGSEIVMTISGNTLLYDGKVLYKWDNTYDSDNSSNSDNSNNSGNTYYGNTRTFTVTGNGKTVTFKMIKVDGGTFQMGSTDWFYDEQPVHSVTLTNDYYMCETEVTQALWYAVMEQSPTSGGASWRSNNGLGDNYPAYYISYEDCESFLSALNSKLSSQLGSGETFRFPTEAEWEFAARGGNKSNGYTYSGSNTIGDVAWFYDNSSSTTHPVKTKAKNELGLYDMSGNVWEWCYDWYGSYSSSAQTDPTGPTSGSGRASRGGGSESGTRFCSVSNRSYDYYAPDGRYSLLGLRLAL